MEKLEHEMPTSDSAVLELSDAGASDWVEESPAKIYEPLTDPARFGQPKMRCEVCGNEYDKAFTVTRCGETHTFDSFECAIHAMAPTCAHCNCRVVGHGVEYDGEIYCCANCARHDGVFGLQDRG